jgi:GAF domain-containing protein
VDADTERERLALAARTFVELADTLVVDFEVHELMTLLVERCTTLLGADGVALMLLEADGGLQLMASSNDRMRFVEGAEVDSTDGPCMDALATRALVQEEDLALGGLRRWPRVSPAALRAGFRGALAVPLRLRDERVGALNLFFCAPGARPDDEARLAQALADMAAIGLLHERSLRERSVLADQLQRALDSRVVIEQAKGMVAEALGVGFEEAFVLMRRFARAHNERLGVLADLLVARRLRPSALVPRAGDLPGRPDAADTVHAPVV